MRDGTLATAIYLPRVSAEYTHGIFQAARRARNVTASHSFPSTLFQLPMSW